jgi:hypothetical protein
MAIGGRPDRFSAKPSRTRSYENNVHISEKLVPTVTTSASTFTLSDSASGVFSQVTTGTFLGSDLTVQPAASLQLANTRSITLVNRPTITNRSLIDITTDNPQGLVLATGDPVVTIQNSGTFLKTGGNATYDIADAISNRSGGLIASQSGELSFSGADPTTNTGVNQTDGTLQVSPTTTLRASAGFSVSGGFVSDLGAGRGFLRGSLTLTGGTVQLGDPATIPQINGAFNFLGGTAQFTCNAPTGTVSRIEDFAGNITINRPNTTIAVQFLGVGTPNRLDVMIARTGTVSDVCQNNPAGYNALLAATLNPNDTYRLQRQAGGGAAPALTSTEADSVGEDWLSILSSDEDDLP